MWGCLLPAVSQPTGWRQARTAGRMYTRQVQEVSAMQRRQGCLAGLLEIFFLNTLFDWLQRRFGFGRGCSCSGCGCGFILLLVFVVLLVNIITGTRWLSLW
jgi:hypothetical protein